MVARAESVKSVNSGDFFVSSFSGGVWVGIVSLIVLHLVVSLFDTKFATLPTNVGDPDMDDNAAAYDEAFEANQSWRNIVRFFQQLKMRKRVYR
jgi:hypothetical protein